MSAAADALFELRVAEPLPDGPGLSAAQMLTAPYWLVRLRHPRQPAVIFNGLAREWRARQPRQETRAA